MNSPQKLKSYPVGAENRPNTIDITFGLRETQRLTTCQSKKWTTLSKCPVLSRCMAYVCVNVDVFLGRRNNRRWKGQGAFIQTHKLLVLGPFSKWVNSPSSLVLALGLV